MNLSIKNYKINNLNNKDEFTYEILSRGRSSLLSRIDMNKVPETLRCAISGRILEDGVTLPCCRKNVSDSVARAELIASNLQCPLCNRQGISPDEVMH
jgi:hypothetical protein